MCMMDPLYIALSSYRRRKYDQCASLCTELLEKNPYDQAIWTLKMKALTEQVYVDDIEAEEEGMADAILDDDIIAQVPRPGTSLRTSSQVQRGVSQGQRPLTQTGRPLSGVVRPGTQTSRPETIEQALKTPRTARTARPVTSRSARSVRLGTASMLTEPGGPFIQISRLNLGKYAANPSIAKPLFEYLFYHENDVRHAMELAVQATEASLFKDWWWKVQLGKCYFVMGLMRDAEQQFRSALKWQQTVETFLRLARVYIRLDQPLTALDVCKTGLEYFPNEVTLTTEIARLFEGMNKITVSVKYYKDILKEDATHVEAIACIGMQHFYTDQPEVALRFYRRLLQMGVYNAELFNNLGLCCFYAQQYDMTLTCFERALNLATDEVIADIWYNIAHIAIGVGDCGLASQCLRLSLSADSNHAPAYNNLGVLELRRGHYEQARAFFQAAGCLAPYLFEPHYNHASLAEKMGDLQTSYIVIQKALEAYPCHTGSQELLNSLQRHFAFI
ncbi:tetratricopeptide repeat protein 8 [Schistocerca americana]|uniref:tetratricopeptide repeat protein 8 n=1 Tax=Schistocerca americana TaxID=7009 RepID=UPI001F4FE8A7|nr:tetratricopeptide repeat protein 8 [Schistocerca americana]XP_047119860.1 tetratricopeptide repeat protein 8 [Schistocerca piceifrons]